MVAAMARIPAKIRNPWRPPVEPLSPVTSKANYVPISVQAPLSSGVFSCSSQGESDGLD